LSYWRWPLWVIFGPLPVAPPGPLSRINTRQDKPQSGRKNWTDRRLYRPQRNRPNAFGLTRSALRIALFDSFAFCQVNRQLSTQFGGCSTLEKAAVETTKNAKGSAASPIVNAGQKLTARCCERDGCRGQAPGVILAPTNWLLRLRLALRFERGKSR